MSGQACGPTRRPLSLAQRLPRPIYGADRVGRRLRSAWSRLHTLGAHLEPASINGEPGALNFDAEGRLINVFVFEISDGLIQAVRSMINPDKLGHLGDQLSDFGRKPGDG